MLLRYDKKSLIYFVTPFIADNGTSTWCYKVYRTYSQDRFLKWCLINRLHACFINNQNKKHWSSLRNMVGEGSGQIRIHANYTWSSSHSKKHGTVWCNAATIETSINSSIDFIKKYFKLLWTRHCYTIKFVSWWGNIR